MEKLNVIACGCVVSNTGTCQTQDMPWIRHVDATETKDSFGKSHFLAHSL